MNAASKRIVKVSAESLLQTDIRPLTQAQEYGEIQASPLHGMKVTVPDESNMHKWEIAMEGPEQSVYAVCLPGDNPLGVTLARDLNEADKHCRAATSSSHSPCPTTTHSSRPSSSSPPRSTTQMSPTTARAPCASACCVQRSGSRQTRSRQSSTWSASCSSSRTQMMPSRSPSPTSGRATGRNLRRSPKAGSNSMLRGSRRPDGKAAAYYGPVSISMDGVGYYGIYRASSFWLA